MSLLEGYESIRRHRGGGRRWGAEVVRRQGLAAWIELCLVETAVQAAGAKQANDEDRRPRPATLNERGIPVDSVSMVRVLAGVAIAQLRTLQELKEEQ